MARRKELQGIANSLNASFVSRNNDYNGYWSVGLLKLFTIDQGLTSVRLTFAMQAASTESKLINDLGRRYMEMLADLMRKQQLPESWIRDAGILIDFNAVDGPARTGNTLTPDDCFRCFCQITDNKGRHYASVLYGRCLPHSPVRELKSNRRLFP